MKSRDGIKIACSRALNNLVYEGVSDVALLERPFETHILKDSDARNELRKELIDRICQNKFEALKLKPIKHILIPKKTLADYRNCSIVDVVDEAIYLSLVLSIARQIEKHRIRCSKKTVFSYRLKIDEDSGRLFDPDYSYQSFNLEASRRKHASANKVMVSCDIASYYDRLNLHRLNSTLLSLDGVDDDIANLIDKLLLFWSGRNSYGLPVGSNASRILAEAELIEVDNYLIQHGVSFCRYVDDYRIFGKDAVSANKDLELLVYALNREGLFLNSGKTRIEDISMVGNPDEIPPEPNLTPEERHREDRRLIFSGYSGLIPLKYRKPSSSEMEKLLEVDIEALLEESIDSVLLDSKQFRTLIKAAEAQERFDRIVEIVSLTERCPQFIPYVVDFAIKAGSCFSVNARNSIGDYFQDILLSNETPEYIRASLSRLYSFPEFERIHLLVQTYLHLEKSAGSYLGRVILERIAGKTTRLETLELRDCGGTTDINELRALARVIAKGLPGPEAKPYLKNLGIHYDDFFISQAKYLRK